MFRMASWAAVVLGLLFVVGSRVAIGLGCDPLAPPPGPAPAPDGGVPDAGRPDAGVPPPPPPGPPDAGTPGYGPGGPWPVDAVKSYTTAYQAGVVQSVSV